MKRNCWEVKMCGRQPGGARVGELGVCPVTVDTSLSGAHGGRNAGRACWVIAGTLCGGQVQGTYAKKLSNCWRCEFLNMVKHEEGSETYGFTITRLGLERIREKTAR
jgi:hypothetical protein